MSMYPDNPAFKEALRQAREKAHQARQRPLNALTQAPDPPESGAGRGGTAGLTDASAGGSGRGRKPKDRRVSASHPTVGQHNDQKISPKASPAAATHLSPRQDLAAATERGAALAAATSPVYRHLPVQPRLGLGPTPATSSATSIYQQMQMNEMQMNEIHNRIALERQERAALLASAQARGELPPAMGLSGRQPPWGAGPRGMPMGLPPAGAAAYDPQLQAEIAAEERWRASQGLPSLFPPGGLPPGTNGRGRGGPPYSAGAALHPSLVNADEMAVATATREKIPGHPGVGDVEPGDRGDATLVAVATAPAREETITPPTPKETALFDLLATAAENTLRKEEEKKKAAAMKDEENKTKDNNHESVDPPDFEDGDTHGSGGSKNLPKSLKRKRKAANEPKNPLGAFVFYQRKIMAEVFEENPCITFGEAAGLCGQRWRALPEEEKQEYKSMAAADKQRYTKELATFKEKHEIQTPTTTKLPKRVGRKKRGQAGRGIIAEYNKKQPKKPRTAFMFYKKEEMPKVFEEFPNVTTGEAATECQARYKGIPKAKKKKYEDMAREDRVRYNEEMAEHRRKLLGEEVQASAVADTKPISEELPVEKENEGSDDEMDKVINGWSPEAVKFPPPVTYDAMVDNNPYYVEEEAWRYHNPPLPPTNEGELDLQQRQQFTYVDHHELRPLPPPPPLPAKFPETGLCQWSLDKENRVLYADFRTSAGDAVLTLEDEKFLLEMYERDDITVISEGLISGLDKEKWSLDYISRVAGDEFYHRFRRFDKLSAEEIAQAKSAKKKGPKGSQKAPPPPAEVAEEVVGVVHGEIDKCLSMKVKDYVSYLRRRSAALAKGKAEENGASHAFFFKDHDGNEHTIDVTKAVLYMIDFDMVKLLPTLYADFMSCFKLLGVLPGGAHCMMNCVNSNGRPFMGPNMYITPPGSFTHFHQDGHGTVDSGHLCLSGYNEVVMVRRLPERHKRHALRFLTGSYKNSRERPYEALYNLPHGDGLGDKPMWPDNEAIEMCNDMNYCVSRFILKEGQHVHINKGRLHAFRKVANEPLPETDCHAKLRANLVKPGTNEKIVGPGKPEILCISVAWDWMFRGVTAKGINREVVSCLECAALNRKYGVLSLAIPELSLLQMAKTLAPKQDENTDHQGDYQESLVTFDAFSGKKDRNGFMPPLSDICKGIFPGLQYVVKQHIYAMNVAESLKSRSFERGKRVSIAKRPNTWENPVVFALDPYGNNDFFCKLCSKELSNVYLHCDGCELLLSKDFNICLECHQEKRYVTSVQMHPLNNKRHSTINHIGNFTYDRASRCPCKNGPVCRHCNFCAGCSCRCHSWFTLHFRCFKKNDELNLLHRVKHGIGREEIDAAEEAEKRLSMSVKGYFDDREGSPVGLHSMDISAVSQFIESDGGSESDEAHGEAGEGHLPAKRRRGLPGDDDPSNEMEIDVEGLMVTIRFKSGDWSEDERSTLRKALREESTWKDIVARLPDRGSDQIRKYALKSFPTLAMAARDRGVDYITTKEESRTKTDSVPGTEEMDIDPAAQGTIKKGMDPEGIEIDSQAATPLSDSQAATPLSDSKAVKTPSDSKVMTASSDSKAVTAPSDSQVMTAPSDSIAATAPSDSKAAIGRSRRILRVKEEIPEEAGTSQTNYASGEADGDKPSENSEEQNEGSENGSPKVRTLSGKWTEEEKERLRVALENEPDMESVERYVGTRRMPQIRSYAPRTFPELFNALRDRMGLERLPEKKKPSQETPKTSERTRVKREASKKKGADDDAAESSRRTSRRSLRTKVSASENEDDEETSTEEEDVASDESLETSDEEKSQNSRDKPNRRSSQRRTKTAEEDRKINSSTAQNEEQKPRAAERSKITVSSAKNILHRKRRQLQSRRQSQDLSGGRKRRNSMPVGKQVDAPASSAPQSSSESEDVPISQLGGSSKRKKIE